LPLQTRSKATGSKQDGLLVLGSGLLTSLLSRLSSVSSASPSATPPLNVLSFAVAATIPLLRKLFPDTGANQHVTLNLATLTDSAPYFGNDHLHVGDGKGCHNPIFYSFIIYFYYIF
jgi:hypothetical protein